MMTTKKPTKLDRMIRSLPPCMYDGLDEMALRLAEDPEDLLVDLCLNQLDLIADGEDGTEDDDPVAIRKWLKKWGKS